MPTARGACARCSFSGLAPKSEAPVRDFREFTAGAQAGKTARKAARPHASAACPRPARGPPAGCPRRARGPICGARLAPISLPSFTGHFWLLLYEFSDKIMHTHAGWLFRCIAVYVRNPSLCGSPPLVCVDLLVKKYVKSC